MQAEEPEFWQDRWRTGQIGFHQSRVEPHLARFWPELALPARSRVFVPLCGKSLDLLWLRDQGHHVVGVEVSALAVEAFFAENALPFTRQRRGPFEVYSADGVTLHCGDLFALTADDLDGVAGIYDRAALICWPPQHRERYVRTMTRLTQAGSGTLLIALEYDQAEMQGPPYSVSDADVRACYEGHHAIRELNRLDILDKEPRLAAKGLTRLQQATYVLERR